MFLFSMMSMFSCDNCWLTKFTVADAFWLPQRLVGIDMLHRTFNTYLPSKKYLENNYYQTIITQ